MANIHPLNPPHGGYFLTNGLKSLGKEVFKLFFENP
jgi:hypothetical protein